MSPIVADTTPLNYLVLIEAAENLPNRLPLFLGVLCVSVAKLFR